MLKRKGSRRRNRRCSATNMHIRMISQAELELEMEMDDDAQTAQTAQRLSRYIKCVIVGSGAVGKTSLLISFTTSAFPADYIPTAFDNYSGSIMVDDKDVILGLWDTVGQEDDWLRPLSYEKTDVFLVCFSCSSPCSLDNVSEKWIPELKAYCPDAPRVLVGLKTDLRADASLREASHERNQLVSYEEGAAAAKALRIPYCECSALTRVGLKNVFQTATRTALNPYVMLCGCIPWPRPRPRKKKAGKGAKQQPWIIVNTHVYTTLLHGTSVDRISTYSTTL